MQLKLIYFDQPFWRAEIVRLCLFISDIEFEDYRRTVFFRGFSDGHSATREVEEERASEGRLIEALRLTDFAKTAFGFVKNARNATTVLDV